MKSRSNSILLCITFCISTFLFVPEVHASAYRQPTVTLEQRRSEIQQYNRSILPPSFEQRFICRIQKRLQSTPPSESAYRRTLIRLSQRFNRSIDDIHILLNNNEPCIQLNKTADATPSSYQTQQSSYTKTNNAPLAESKNTKKEDPSVVKTVNTDSFVAVYKQRAMSSSSMHSESSVSISSVQIEKSDNTVESTQMDSIVSQLRVLCLVQKRIERNVKTSATQKKTYATILAERWNVSESAVYQLLGHKDLCNPTDVITGILDGTHEESVDSNNQAVTSVENIEKIEQTSKNTLSDTMSSLPSLLLLIGGMMIGAFILLIVLIVSLLVQPTDAKQEE